MLIARLTPSYKIEMQLVSDVVGGLGYELGDRTVVSKYRLSPRRECYFDKVLHNVLKR